MIFEETRIPGAFILEVERMEDERGFFARAWCRKEFQARGLNPDMGQSNISFNKKKGTLRGLHYQVAPLEEAKLVRCTRGAIFDVAVDLRPDSPTYLDWVGAELTADNRRMLYVPEGCAHGYQTLEDDTEVFYQVSQFYSPEAERGARWDDPAIGIEWRDTGTFLISEKDASWPLLTRSGSSALTRG